MSRVCGGTQAGLGCCRRLLLWGLAVASACLILWNPAGAQEGNGVLLAWSPDRPRQGQVVHLRVETREGGALRALRFNGKPVLFFKGTGEDKVWHALVGIDAQLEPGVYDLEAWLSPGPSQAVGDQVEKVRIQVMAGDFPDEHLKLPAKMVDLSPQNLARVQEERARLEALWARETPEKFWDGPFLVPVSDGKAGTPFGVRRWINGQPRSPHTGLDITAPEGTPVQAANSGKVVLVAEHFFEGKCVFIDHGAGLYTMYFHLKEPRVRQGQSVQRGEVIGWVGSTGRATGPHLHWGVRLAGARVDPVALIEATSAFP